MGGQPWKWLKIIECSLYRGYYIWVLYLNVTIYMRSLPASKPRSWSSSEWTKRSHIGVTLHRAKKNSGGYWRAQVVHWVSLREIMSCIKSDMILWECFVADDTGRWGQAGVRACQLKCVYHLHPVSQTAGLRSVSQAYHRRHIPPALSHSASQLVL